MTVGDRVPTLGDLCDVNLVTEKNDPWALVRLCTRWLEPEPTIEQLRALTIFELHQHFDAILTVVRDKAVVLMMDPGKRKH